MVLANEVRRLTKKSDALEKKLLEEVKTLEVKLREESKVTMHFKERYEKLYQEKIALETQDLVSADGSSNSCLTSPIVGRTEIAPRHASANRGIRLRKQ
jgi:hypothetical protein